MRQNNPDILEQNRRINELTRRVVKLEMSQNSKEWVIIANPESDSELNVMGGKVLAHSPKRDLIDRALMEYAQVQSLAIEYTGPIPDDYAVML